MEGAGVEDAPEHDDAKCAALQLLGNYRLQCDMLPNVKPVRQPSHEIEFYYSFRSPYSQIAIKRVFRIARATGAKVRYESWLD